MRSLIPVIVLAGCQFSALPPEAATGDDALPAIDAAIDAEPDAVPDALATCPPPGNGCVAFSCGTSTHCYYACTIARNATDAATRCVDDGMGCLVTIDSDQENTCVALSVLPPPVFPNLLWTGFVQTPGSPEPAGGWGWRCGTSTYTAGNWGNFEPNNSGGNENCGTVNELGAWIDGDCNSQLRYICEFPR